MKPIINYIHENPQVGFLSGIGSGTLLFLQQMFTDEETLKIVAGVGAWAGCMVALFSLVLWSIKVYDTFKLRFKK